MKEALYPGFLDRSAVFGNQEPLKSFLPMTVWEMVSPRQHLALMGLLEPRGGGGGGTLEPVPAPPYWKHIASETFLWNAPMIRMQ